MLMQMFNVDRMESLSPTVVEFVRVTHIGIRHEDY